MISGLNTLRKMLVDRSVPNKPMDLSSRLSFVGISECESFRITGNFSKESIVRALAKVEQSFFIKNKAQYLCKLLQVWEGDGDKYKLRFEKEEKVKEVEKKCLQQEAEEYSQSLLSGGSSNKVKNYIEMNLDDSSRVQIPPQIKRKIKEDLSMESWRDSSRVRLALRLLLSSENGKLDLT